MAETLTGAPARNYVGGEWRESASGETYEKRNPWRPSQVVGVYPASDAEDAHPAVAADRAHRRGVLPRARSAARWAERAPGLRLESRSRARSQPWGAGHLLHRL